jgi:hypothetical protein
MIIKSATKWDHVRQRAGVADRADHREGVQVADDGRDGSQSEQGQASDQPEAPAGPCGDIIAVWR